MRTQRCTSERRQCCMRAQRCTFRLSCCSSIGALPPSAIPDAIRIKSIARRLACACLLFVVCCLLFVFLYGCMFVVCILCMSSCLHVVRASHIVQPYRPATSHTCSMCDAASVQPHRTSVRTRQHQTRASSNVHPRQSSSPRRACRSYSRNAPSRFQAVAWPAPFCRLEFSYPEFSCCSWSSRRAASICRAACHTSPNEGEEEA
jgi:hypothetical protein